MKSTNQRFDELVSFVNCWKIGIGFLFRSTISNETDLFDFLLVDEWEEDFFKFDERLVG